MEACSSSTNVTGSGYVGRFAPSPTGPLHAGSLVAAVASFLDARAHEGRWLLRIEDVDRPRTVAGATEAILRALTAHGLRWDGEVLVQSSREHRYARALAKLSASGRVFACDCSRSDVRQHPLAARGPDGEWLYPGTCRARSVRTPADPANARNGRHAMRLRVDDASIDWDDRLLGPRHECIADSCGDFVLKRADGCWAYHLAVVVDDAACGVTDVVRGDDLIGSTARQCLLQTLLGHARPRYLHVPVVRDTDGAKLSKQTGAPAIEVSPSPARAVANLDAALSHLGIEPCRTRDTSSWLPLAIERWRRWLALRTPSRTSGCDRRR